MQYIGVGYPRGMSTLDSRERFFLKSSRVAFRLWRADDLPLAMALWGDPLVTQYLGGAFSPQQVQERLDTEIANMELHGIQYWPFFLLSSREFVGCCGLKPRQPEQRIYEIGAHLCRPYWGMGLAEEAARAVARYAFETLEASELFAGHHPDNAASRRLLEKAGFTYTHDELYPPTGQMHPGYVMKRPSQL